MKKRGSLKRLFNKAAVATVLSAGVLSGPVAAQSASVPPAKAPPVVQAVGCPAFPDFKKPDGPMHRVPRDHTIDLALRADQIELKSIGITPGATDGLNGATTRAAIREFLLFYAPLYKGDANKWEMSDKDSAELKKYADAAAANAKTYKISTAQAAAFGLAAARTGTPLSTLAKNSTQQFDTQAWLYMVKTYGASYGLEFYAPHISAGADGRLAVDNPFIFRQLLTLKDHQRLSALMTAEYLNHKDTVPAPAAPAAAASDAALAAQQKDLLTLGFDIGKSADGLRSDLTLISIQEFQLLYGAGKPTGILSADEIRTLSGAATQARADAETYNAPSTAAGPIRMASKQSGADFSYMMHLAGTESSFMHNARATTSSATGLYQFIESTWGYMIQTYGAKHGFGDFASQVETYKDDLGRDQSRIPNPLVRQVLLDTRANPQVSALFAADFQDENKAKESCYVSGAITPTDMYLAHFLGPSDAVWFLNSMQKTPGKSAPATFPEEAQYNENVFYDTRHGAGRDRSLNEVYNNFQRKIEPDAKPANDVKPVLVAAHTQTPAVHKPHRKRPHHHG